MGERGGGGGASQVNPFKKGGGAENVLAMLKGEAGHRQFRGSFNMGP